MTDKPLHIVVSATFTADQIADLAHFWAGYLGRTVTTELAPFAQVYQQLLQPESALRCNDGANVMLVRWKDLAVDLPQAYARAARELSDAVGAATFRAPLLVMLCPEESEAEAVAEANEIFAAGVEGTPGITVLKAAESFALYDVEQAFDPLTEQTGQVPYTAEAYAAIGTHVFRWIDAGIRKPVKLLAVDCDNTLWGGVIGEDGVNGIEISAGHLALQRELIVQADRGRVVGLLSKNEQEDVAAVLDERSDMVLGAEHVVSRRVNWLPKAENLADLATELNLGMNSILFLDDSTVEVAEMRAFHPDVLSVRIPTESTDLTAFCDHLWLFDQFSVTREDQSRVQMYKEQAEREANRRASASLEDFFETLELEVSIAVPGEAELERFAQLTQRTNQFNASMKRLTLSDVQQDSADEDCAIRIVSARDRFGDYGIVGAMRMRAADVELLVDIFLLSCRALGRGIEHKMVAALGELAAEYGLDRVHLQYQEGPRNQPVRHFLDRFEKPGVAQGTDLVLNADQARNVRFNPAVIASNDNAAIMSPKGFAPEGSMDAGATYQKITRELDSAARILQAMRGEVRHRPDLATGFIAPSSQMERQVTAIWEDILRIDRIGIHDSFTELGGKSIQLVQIHALLQKKLGLKLEFTDLFEHGTIASLALKLEDNKAPPAAFSSANRSQKMRAARQRRAAVMREKKEALS